MAAEVPAVMSSLYGNVIPGLSIPEHDHIALSYTGNNVTGITYRQGGGSGHTVATLTLTYNGSNQLTAVSIARS